MREAIEKVPGITSVEPMKNMEEGVAGFVVETTSENDIREDISMALLEAHCPVIALTKTTVSLEDVYLALTKDLERRPGKQKKYKKGKGEA